MLPLKMLTNIRTIRTRTLPLTAKYSAIINICVIRISLRQKIFKNMKKHFILFLTVIFFSTHQLLSQTYSNEFLAIGVGARAHGMSGAVTATTNDLYSSYWNPAGLTQLDVPFQIGVMHAEWFGGVAKYDFLGFAKPLSNGTKKRAIGLSVIRLGIDQIPYTLNLVGADGSINYDNVSQFSAADYAVQMTYAQELNKNFSIGGNMKIIRRVIGTMASAWGVGADLGIQYRKGNWRLAAVGRDITTTYNAWTATLTDEEIRLGKELSIKSNSISLNGTLLVPENDNLKKLVVVRNNPAKPSVITGANFGLCNAKKIKK